MRSFLALCLLVSTTTTHDLYPIEELCKERINVQCFLPMENGVERWQNTSRNTVNLLALNRAYYETWLVVVRISQNVGPDSGMTLSVNGELLFGCETKDGYRISLAPGKHVKTELRLSYLRRSLFYCEFTVSAMDGHEIGELFAKGELVILVKQAGSELRSIVEATYLYEEVVKNKAEYKKQCDINAMKYESYSEVNGESSLRPTIVEKHASCSIESMELFVKKAGKYARVSHVDCHEDYCWSRPVNGGVDKYDSRNPIIATCSGRTCTLCSEVDGLNGEDPPEYTPPDIVNCAQLTCPKHMPALVTAFSNATLAKPVCKRFDEGDFRWTISSPDGKSDVFFTEASCAKTVSCQDVNPLNIICDPTTNCSLIDPWAQKVVCSGDNKLAVRSSESESWELAHHIECDVTNGTWTKTVINREESPLQSGEEIICFTAEEARSIVTAAPITSSSTSTEPSTTTTTTELKTTVTMTTKQITSAKIRTKKSNSGVIIGVIAGCLIFLVILVISLVFLVKRRSKAVKTAEAKVSVGKKEVPKPASIRVVIEPKQTPPISTQTITPPESEKKQEKPLIEPKKEEVKETVSVPPAQEKLPLEEEEKDEKDPKKNKVQEMLETSVVSEKTGE